MAGVGGAFCEIGGADDVGPDKVGAAACGVGKEGKLPGRVAGPGAGAAISGRGRGIGGVAIGGADVCEAASGAPGIAGWPGNAGVRSIRTPGGRRRGIDFRAAASRRGGLARKPPNPMDRARAVPMTRPRFTDTASVFVISSRFAVATAACGPPGCFQTARRKATNSMPAAFAC